mmetsp:Transcript_5322/g.11637  ORF Transcript_5322/g.11637 Transcript_5322/m.11637 type:complete len:93 (+) Transcript_5322:955-1233(+)
MPMDKHKQTPADKHKQMHSAWIAGLSFGYDLCRAGLLRNHMASRCLCGCVVLLAVVDDKYRSAEAGMLRSWLAWLAWPNSQVDEHAVMMSCD